MYIASHHININSNSAKLYVPETVNYGRCYKQDPSRVIHLGVVLFRESHLITLDVLLLPSVLDGILSAMFNLLNELISVK